MGFSHLRTEAALATFRTRFNISLDVDIEYYPEGNIENDRCPRVVFFPLMAILEGGELCEWTPSYLGPPPTAFPLTNFYQTSIEWWVVWVDLTTCTP